MSFNNYTDKEKERAVEGYKNADQDTRIILDRMAEKNQTLKDLIDYCKTELGE